VRCRKKRSAEGTEIGAQRSPRGTPPRHFGKRVWICLIAKELTFLETPKSPQNTENMGFATETPRHRGGKLMKRKGKWRVTSDEWRDRARRADEKIGFATEARRTQSGDVPAPGMWGTRRHAGLRKKEETKRGHCQQNLELENTASVTTCQVRNKDGSVNSFV